MARAPQLLVLASTYPRWANDPEPGFVHELSRRLAEHFEVTVLAPHAPGAQTRATLDGIEVQRWRYAPAPLETLVQDGGIVANLRRSPWKWLLVPAFLATQLWATAGLLRRLRPAVVHAHWIVPQGLVIALLHSVMPRCPPFVLTVHGGDLHALNLGPLPALKRWILRRAGAITVVNAAMLEPMARLGVAPQRLSVLRMGTDWSARFTPPAAGNAPRAAGELLFVGRLVPKKGLPTLLAALPKICAAHPGARLTVAGFGPDEALLRRQAAALGLADRVTFAGAVPPSELPALYRRAAVFVAPSVEDDRGDQDGLTVTLMEAIGCGCPVVASGTPGLAELLGPGGAEAVFPPGDVDALTQAVTRVLGDAAGAGRIAAQRREALAASVDWRGVAAAYARLLETTAG